jgi:sugar phosphate isomerase/epimerase
MQAGISTACLYPMLLEKSFSTLVSMGFRHYEVFVNTFSELGKDYLVKLKQTADESGSTIRSVHPFTSGYESFLMFSEYKRRFEDSLEFYKRYLRACNLLGAEILVLHGRKRDRTGISDEEFFDRYLRLYKLGREFGVTVAQENVNLFCSDDPLFIRKMRRACGNDCAFVLDIKQAVRGGVNPYEMCDAMGEKICHVHINDNSAGSDCLLPGFGDMDYARLIHALEHFGYRGSLIIEVYRKSFGELCDLFKAKKTVESLLKNLIKADN